MPILFSESDLPDPEANSAADLAFDESSTKRSPGLELAEGFIPPEFLRADVRVQSQRHLMFATKQQLEFLASAKSWYIDAMFKLCRHPFTQLMTINAFVRKDDHAKQVPLLFVLMSRRKKADYCKVLNKGLEILPSIPAVKQIPLDFKKATWAALREGYPNVKLHGCVFHWTQALGFMEPLGAQQTGQYSNMPFAPPTTLRDGTMASITEPPDMASR